MENAFRCLSNGDFVSFRFTSCKAFKILMNEINDLAGQHEVVAENLQANVIKELNALVKDIREERKVSRSLAKDGKNN